MDKPSCVPNAAHNPDIVQGVGSKEGEGDSMCDEEFEPGDKSPRYKYPEKIDCMEIFGSLSKRHLLGNDTYLKSQALNLGIVDNFITDLEYNVPRELHEMKKERVEDMDFTFM